MKKSSDWLRQTELDKKLDRLVEQRGCGLEDLTPYDAAKALSVDPGGEFYKKVRDWKQRRTAESDEDALEVPPHVQAGFRKTLDEFVGTTMDQFLREVRAIGGDFNRAATRRVVDAEQRASEAQAEVAGLLDHWMSAESERDAARARVVELQRALMDARRCHDRLLGRLEERETHRAADELEVRTDSAPLAFDNAQSGQMGDNQSQRYSSVADGRVDFPIDDHLDAEAPGAGAPQEAAAEGESDQSSPNVMERTNTEQDGPSLGNLSSGGISNGGSSLRDGG